MNHGLFSLSAVALLAIAPSAFGAPLFAAHSKVTYQGTDGNHQPCALSVSTDDQARVYLVDGHFAPQPSDNGQITLYFDYNDINGLPLTTPLEGGFSINTTRLTDGALTTMGISFHVSSTGALSSIDASSSWVGVISTEVSCMNLRQL